MSIPSYFPVCRSCLPAIGHKGARLRRNLQPRCRENLGGAQLHSHESCAWPFHSLRTPICTSTHLDPIKASQAPQKQ